MSHPEPLHLPPEGADLAHAMMVPVACTTCRGFGVVVREQGDALFVDCGACRGSGRQ